MIISNGITDENKLKRATDIIIGLQNELKGYIVKGHGPFLAAVYDEKGNLIAKTANSVINETCSNNHAEMNVIKAAEKALGTYDLSSYNLSLYVTSEPCMMCLGGIMWSGIKAVYYGVPSKRVEEITGFDEGFKPDWFNEFKKRGITVYGNIAQEIGEEVLRYYVNQGNTVYQPER
ncbi:MAG: nucleoside deaminase [Alphaproteobacteria bacterium]|nr:nucleoside deaminase [Alphaproteobacteria bacterium]